MSVSHQKAAYQGLDRRSCCDRRNGGERRNLVRYEALGSDRRERVLRRREDMLWFSVQEDSPANSPDKAD